jgi:hypothetical protein
VGCGAGPGGLVAAAKQNGAAGRAGAGRHQPAGLALRAANAALATAWRTCVRARATCSRGAGQFDLIVANPPYLVDPAGRTYRNGGGEFGDGPVRAHRRAKASRGCARAGGWCCTPAPPSSTAATRCSNRWNGRLWTCAAGRWRYRELDPDVFGEELLTAGLCARRAHRRRGAGGAEASMRILGIGESNDLAAMYHGLVRRGHEVRVCVEDPAYRDVYAGMLDIVDDWEAELGWVREAGEDGIVLFESARKGERRTAAARRLPGDRRQRASATGWRPTATSASRCCARPACARRPATASPTSNPRGLRARKGGRYVLKFNGADSAAHAQLHRRDGGRLATCWRCWALEQAHGGSRRCPSTSC